MSDKVMTREAAVAVIRRRLIELQEPGKSTCRIATERNILCRGFRRDSTVELRRRYADKIDDVRDLPREELEEQASSWHLERAKAENVHLSCDVQHKAYETCCGWDDFSNEELARFCFELLEEQVVVIGKKSPPVI